MFQLSYESVIGRIPEQKGVYKLYAFRLNELPIPIQRFGGVDNSGVLYIGQTTKQTLRKRIYNLLATTRQNGKTTNHSGGLKYRNIQVIRKILGEHLLYFDFCVCDNPSAKEKELLIEYSNVYGEYPPLNK